MFQFWMHWINLMSVASKIKSPFAWFDLKYIIRLPSFTLHWPDVYMSWYDGNIWKFDCLISMDSVAWNLGSNVDVDDYMRAIDWCVLMMLVAESWCWWLFQWKRSVTSMFICHQYKPAPTYATNIDEADHILCIFITLWYGPLTSIWYQVF